MNWKIWKKIYKIFRKINFSKIIFINDLPAGGSAKAGTIGSVQATMVSDGSLVWKKKSLIVKNHQKVPKMSQNGKFEWTVKSKCYKKRGATFFYDVTRKLGPLDFTQYRSKSSSF